MMRFFILRVFLSVFFVFSGCSSLTSSTSIFPPYRHPLFHRQTDIGSAIFSQATRGLPEHRAASSCNHVFNHPLLNRCEMSTNSKLPTATFPKAPGDPIDKRLELARKARLMLSDHSFSMSAQTYRRDCSGFVMAVFASEGIPIERMMEFPRSKVSVVTIYQMASQSGMLHRYKVPEIGDLVFFNDTYDRNGDGRLNDPLTHIGIVERIDADGTVSFIHHVRTGVLRYKLNRFKPHIRRDPETRKVLNHYLRVGSQGPTNKRLTGELFCAYASIIR